MLSDASHLILPMPSPSVVVNLLAHSSHPRPCAAFQPRYPPERSCRPHTSPKFSSVPETPRQSQVELSRRIRVHTSFDASHSRPDAQ
ncbi:hypothetical protein C8Q77DRAFT_274588 [Trametes polyzona]|nr:hypothetical protein C8Q77DRAFT_274588 [Trametes polyzona]